MMRYVTHFCIVLFLFLLLACEPVSKVEHAATNSVLSGKSGEAVRPNTPLVFPNDHGEHRQQGIEWWYLTSTLTSEQGESFGVQWTLFRTLVPSALQSSWWDGHFYFSHFALQHQQQHVSFERFARKGQAKVTASPFVAAIDDWQLSSESTGFLPLKLNVQQDQYEVDLTLENSPLVLHGENGYSQKTASGHASYYFSYPFLDVTGSLVFKGKTYQVTGHAWYDREWSASLLDKDKLGWDWFSLVDESQGKKRGLMLFCIRKQKQDYDYCSGTKINDDGSTQTYSQQQIALSVVDTVMLDGRQYPSKWQVIVPDIAPLVIETVTKDSRNQLSIEYWEGRVSVSGGFNGQGYAELTGY